MSVKRKGALKVNKPQGTVRPGARVAANDASAQAELSTLAEELVGVALNTLKQFGFTRKEARLVVENTLKKRTTTKASRRLMSHVSVLGELKRLWSTDPKYLTSAGAPEHLPIRGKGATIESLARRVGLALPTERIVDLLCKHAEIARLPNDRLAMVGGPAMIVPRSSPEYTLAAIVNRTETISNTVAYNGFLNPGTLGLYERHISSTMPVRTFNKFALSIRSVLQGLADRVDSEMESVGGSVRAKKRGPAVGIGIYVWKEDEA
jgi:hypothetical protein